MSISAIRFQEIAEKAVSKLLEIDREEAIEFFREEFDFNEYEMKYFEIPTGDEEDYYDEDISFEDDSDISCGDASDDECNGHCMSCSYRSY